VSLVCPALFAQCFLYVLEANCCKLLKDQAQVWLSTTRNALACVSGNVKHVFDKTIQMLSDCRNVVDVRTFALQLQNPTDDDANMLSSKKNTLRVASISTSTYIPHVFGRARRQGVGDARLVLV